MNKESQWVEIQKIKQFQAVVERKFKKQELTSTTPSQSVELNTFHKVDLTPRLPKWIDSANEGVPTLPQPQQCNVMGTEKNIENLSSNFRPN